MSFELTGQFRHRFERLSDFTLDEAGTSHGQPNRHWARARVGARMSFSRNFWVSSTIQLLNGQILGAESPVSNGVYGEPWHNVPFANHLQLRESTIQLPIGMGIARIGRMPIRWGMGLAVHDGDTRDTPFAEPHRGDIVNGVWIDVLPLLPFTRSRLGYGLHLGLGGDIIEQSADMHRSRGDLGWRLAATLTWEEPWFRGGLYVMHRELERATLETSEHMLIDASGRFETLIEERFALIIEAEVALLSGAEISAPTDGLETTEIDQLGAATRVTLTDRELATLYALEIGYASGDGDPDDARDTAYRFNPARRVGMILFSDVLARLSAREMELQSAPSATVRPTNGAVSNALYMAPRVALTLCDGCVSLEAGGLVAFAPDPWRAEENPDEPTAGHLPGGEAKAGALGYELNAGATVTFNLETIAHFSIGTQYGLFLPGEALSAFRHDAVHKWRLLADVTW